jgi:hypothetical protein
MWNRQRIATFLIAINVLAFQLNYIVFNSIFGRGGGFGISIDFVTSLIIAIIGVIYFMQFLFSQKAVAILLSLFTGWILLGALFTPSNTRTLVTPLALLAIMSGTYILFRRYWGRLSSSIPWIYYITVVGFQLIILLLIEIGIYKITIYRGLGAGMSFKALNVGNLLSTELSVFEGVQFIYLMYLWKIGFNKKLLLIPSVIELYLIYDSASAAAFGGLILVCLYYLWSFNLNLGKKVISLLLLGACLSLFSGQIMEKIINPYSYRIEDKIAGLTEMGARKYLYDLSISLARQHPLFGVGLGRFQDYEPFGHVPHQNLLGRASEDGFPAMVFYAMFVVCSLWLLFHKKNQILKPSFDYPELKDSALFIEMCFMVLLYLQFRGLFTDTWTLKEQYFLIGGGLGVAQWVNHKIKTVKLSY